MDQYENGYATNYPDEAYTEEGDGGDGYDRGYDDGGGYAPPRSAVDDGQAFLLPDSVKDFIFDLHDSMRRSQVLDELEKLYNDTFKTLSEAYFKQSPWPAGEVIADQCGHDELFLCFYEEMRLRHAFAIGPQTLHDRFAAWNNYCRLVESLLEAKDRELVLPPQWAFDIVHEFVYQFQSFCQYRTQLSHRNGEERGTLAENPDVWAAQNVLSYLHGLIRVSNIVATLEAKRQPRGSGPAVPASAPAPPPSQAHGQLGYFSIVAMSRLQCLLADYTGCLQALAPLDLADKNQPVANCLLAYVSLHMHMGTSFLMLKRYRDAARAFNEILVHVSRAYKSGQLQRLAAADHITNQADKMLVLLAISTTLAPGLRLDEGVGQTMRDAHRDKLTRMAEGEEAAFRELFQWAAPKFIVASVPDYGATAAGGGGKDELLEQQVRLFMEDVKQQRAFPQIRSHLKLYTTIGLEKMARFNSMDATEFKSALVSMKHKMTQRDWATAPEGSGPLEGKPTLVLDFNYYVEGEMIHVDEQVKEQRFERYFIGAIHKCDALAQQAARIKT